MKNMKMPYDGYAIYEYKPHLKVWVLVIVLNKDAYSCEEVKALLDTTLKLTGASCHEPKVYEYVEGETVNTELEP